MTQKLKWLIVSGAAMAGGVLTLYLTSPETARNARQALTGAARERRRWLGDGLSEIENQLLSLEKQLHDAAQELNQRLDDVKQRALEEYLPDAPLKPEDWKLTRSDVDHDLPGLPGP